ncbi:MAG: hypothetical protein ACR2JY_06470 [Chloroflexota bacterium]
MSVWSFAVDTAEVVTGAVVATAALVVEAGALVPVLVIATVVAVPLVAAGADEADAELTDERDPLLFDAVALTEQPVRISKAVRSPVNVRVRGRILFALRDGRRLPDAAFCAGH